MEASINLILLIFIGHLFALIDDQVETLEDEIALENNVLTPSRVNRCGIFSTATFAWMNPIIRAGSRKNLTMKDVPDLEEEDNGESIIKDFEAKRGKHRSLFVTLFSLYPSLLAKQSLSQIAGGLLSTAEPLGLYALMNAVTAKEKPRSEILFFSLLLAATVILRVLCRQTGFQIERNLGIRYSTILVNEIYKKSLKRIPFSSDSSDDTKRSASTGKIVSLMSGDAHKIKMTMPYTLDAIAIFLEIAAAVGALLWMVGWPGLVGLSVMVASFPITYIISKWIDKMFRRLNAATDDRTTIINEVLQGIRIIKYFGWEDRFESRISESRKKELDELIPYYIQMLITNFILFLLPNLVAYSTLIAITQWQGKILEAKLAFTCLALFSAIREPMSEIPEVVVEISKVKVSLGRIEAFLAEDEFKQHGNYNQGSDEDIEIGFRNGTFRWFFNPNSPKSRKFRQEQQRKKNASKTPTTDEPATQSPHINSTPSTSDSNAFTLHDLNLAFPLGKLTAIFGPTGSGKSSLLLALLGEMNRTTGTCFLPSSSHDQNKRHIALVAQTSWLRNATIRSNIIFGEPYNPTKYASVIHACSLEKDLSTFPAGDMTEIGEKGINLSGGQKQRVSLARAAYSSSNIILLDDPLSAVDAPTAKHLFHKTILGLMKGRTVILVTHATQLVLPAVDHAVVMAEGRVIANGSVTELIGHQTASAILGLRPDPADSNGEDDGLSIQSLLESINAYRDSMSVSPVSNFPAETDVTDFSNGKDAVSHRLINDEAMEVGSIKFKVYLDYIRVAGGWWIFLAIAVVLVAGRLTNIASSYWIREWTNRVNGTSNGETMVALTEDTRKESLYFANVYFLLSLAWVVCYVLVVFIRCIGSYAASKKLHQNLIHRILHAPTKFFDTTPIGRILNRTTSDITTIDQLVMSYLTNFIGYITELFFIVVVIGTITPLFFVALAPAIAAYHFFGKRYLNFSIQLKRLESITRSPIYAMFSETLTGASTIRAYAATDRLTKENLDLVNISNRAFFYLWGANRWLSVRLAIISGSLVLMCGISVTLARDHLDAGLVGIALTLALRVMEFLKNAVKCYGSLEMHIQSVERLKEYTEIEQEAPFVIENHRPPPNWPSKGEIQIKNLSMHYNSNSPPVLKNLTLTVERGSKLGIVGRTGAGKTSLSLSLFRIVEPSTGSIVIDGIDISTIGLKDLRTRLTIIPQDPTLFQGSVRSNLDPFDEHTDDQILEALENVKFYNTLQRSKDIPVEGSEDDVRIEVDGVTTVTSFDIRSFSLNSSVSEGGTNFSQGQRQLLCLTRALLKRTKIMVLDEATASVDNETDTKIQEAIRNETFSQTTIITIAHRLRTVIDYDKILVLDEGKIAQHGSPLELMSTEGIFKTMCEETGEFSDLIALARDAIGRRSSMQ
ncbi:hypothetical protein HDU97_002488 [Phlyctochytrium planicorne]|nr:hypothetical protein HDU97_002488 [Phlyctochytrium planicorne]